MEETPQIDLYQVYLAALLGNAGAILGLPGMPDPLTAETLIAARLGQIDSKGTDAPSDRATVEARIAALNGTEHVRQLRQIREMVGGGVGLTVPQAVEHRLRDLAAVMTDALEALRASIPSPRDVEDAKGICERAEARVLAALAALPAQASVSLKGGR